MTVTYTVESPTTPTSEIIAHLTPVIAYLDANPAIAHAFAVLAPLDPHASTFVKSVWSYLWTNGRITDRQAAAIIKTAERLAPAPTPVATPVVEVVAEPVDYSTIESLNPEWVKMVAMISTADQFKAAYAELADLAAIATCMQVGPERSQLDQIVSTMLTYLSGAEGRFYGFTGGLLLNHYQHVRANFGPSNALQAPADVAELIEAIDEIAVRAEERLNAPADPSVVVEPMGRIERLDSLLADFS